MHWPRLLRSGPVPLSLARLLLLVLVLLRLRFLLVLPSVRAATRAASLARPAPLLLGVLALTRA
eukprot:scaffold910_cov115-Isochrysis_galbana.AAC.1